MKPAASALVLLASLSTGACAWSNPTNRPVWNAFEATLVPDDATAFAVALPVTIPLGLGAILTDTFVAHPIQIADEAWDDAAYLWRDLPWQEHYYTQAGFAPLRAVATPALLALSFVGRSAFDLPTRASIAQAQADREARREAQAQDLHRRHLDALRAVAAGSAIDTPFWPPAEWHEDFAEPLREALATGRPAARLQLLVTSVGSAGHAQIDWNAALSDESAVLRHAVLKALVTAGQPVPLPALERLRSDPDAAVRELAERLESR